MLALGASTAVPKPTVAKEMVAEGAGAPVSRAAVTSLASIVVGCQSCEYTDDAVRVPRSGAATADARRPTASGRRSASTVAARIMPVLWPWAVSCVRATVYGWCSFSRTEGAPVAAAKAKVRPPVISWVRRAMDGARALSLMAPWRSATCVAPPETAARCVTLTPGSAGLVCTMCGANRAVDPAGTAWCVCLGAPGTTKLPSVCTSCVGLGAWAVASSDEAPGAEENAVGPVLCAVPTAAAGALAPPPTPGTMAAVAGKVRLTVASRSAAVIVGLGAAIWTRPVLATADKAVVVSLSLVRRTVGTRGAPE